MSREISEFKIGQYADPYFRDCPFNVFDFKTMLGLDFSTNKKIYMLPNGRPEKNEYFVNTELVAVIYFTFVTTGENLLIERKEELVYVDLNGQESNKILIKTKTFNTSDTKINDGAIAMRERENARREIVSSMKAYLGGILIMALGQTLDEVTQTIKPFWDNYKLDRENFIDLGLRDWAKNLSALTISADYATAVSNAEPYPFLSIPLAPNFQVRDFIASKMVY